jgi:hypothetical protein
MQSSGSIRPGDLCSNPRVLPGLRYFLKHLGSSFRLINARRHVCLGDDPDKLIVVIDDRDAAQLMPSHRIRSLLKIIASEAANDCARHYQFHSRGFGIDPFSYNPQSQITIGQDSDQFPGLRIFDYRERTDVLAPHQLGRF